MKKLIENIDLIATFNEKLEEIKNGWIFIDNNIIKKIGSGNGPDMTVDETIDGRGMLILPGFVNTHHHFYQSLFRVIPETQNAKLFDWLVFLYKKWMNIDEEAVKISTVIAILEMMKSGVTTTVDHLYVFPKGHPHIFDAELEGARLTGVRFYGIRGSMSLSKKDGGLPPDLLVQTEDEILKDYERVFNLFHDPKPFSMSRVALGPCSLFTVTEKLMIETAKFAEKNNLLIHTHLGETRDEREFCILKYSLRPVDYMEKVNWLTDRTWFAHLVHLNNSEIEKLSNSKVGMAYCPTSNMRLGDGIAPVYKMKNTSIRISFGVDGSASNDTGNFLQEIRNGMLLQRVKYGARALTARESLYMGTIGGANVLRLNNEIGSIEKGKAADIIGFNLNRLEFAGGLTDPVSALVFCDAKKVDFSMINGEIVIKDGKFVEIDEQEFIEKHNSISRKLLSY
jgi:cytosine/adenosine deaminase-related metal-dependent hydrolase